MGKLVTQVTDVQARKIMGQNYFGVEEGVKHFGIEPTPDEVSMLQIIPYTREYLERCKDTHTLTAVFPLHILAIRERVDRSLFRKHEDAWYNDEMLATTTRKAGWYLLDMCKDQTLDKVINTEDRIRYPAQVFVYSAIGHFLNTGERMLRTIYAPCCDKTSFGPQKRVYVGFFLESSGLDILML